MCRRLDGLSVRSTLTKFFGLLFCMFASVSYTQTKINPNTQINWPQATGSGAPVAACTSTNYGALYMSTAGISYFCGVAGWTANISTASATSQTVNQPSGTTLGVNSLNAVLHANYYQSPANTGNNGIGNAFASSDCVSGCTVVADPGYAYIDRIGDWTGLLSQNSTPVSSMFTDQRKGMQFKWSRDPVVSNFDNQFDNFLFGCQMDQLVGDTHGYVQLGGDCFHAIVNDSVPGWSYGNNVLANHAGWYTHSLGIFDGVSHAAGIKGGIYANQASYGVGDTNLIVGFLTYKGGRTAISDQAATGQQIGVQEAYPYEGTAVSYNSSTGLLILSPNANYASYGTGMPLIDKTTGVLTGTGIRTSESYGYATIQTSLTLPVSTRVTLVANLDALRTAGNVGSTQTFAVTTSTDLTPLVGNKAKIFGQNAETFVVTAVGAFGSPVTGQQTITANIRHGYTAGVPIFIGGAAGMYLEQTADTQTIGPNTFRYMLDVLGSTSSNTIVVASLLTGSAAQPSYWTQNTYNPTATTVSGSTTVTLTAPATYAAGLSVIGAGIPAGATVATATNYSNTFTLSAPATASASGVTLAISNSEAITLYNGAEIWSANDPSTNLANGYSALIEPFSGTINAGDAIEVPNHISMSGNTTLLTSTLFNPYTRGFIPLAIAMNGKGGGSEVMSITNGSTSEPSGIGFDTGVYENYIHAAYAPDGPLASGNGCVICVGPQAPGSTRTSYDIIAGDGGPIAFTYTPSTGTYSTYASLASAALVGINGADGGLFNYLIGGNAANYGCALGQSNWFGTNNPTTVIFGLDKCGTLNVFGGNGNADIRVGGNYDATSIGNYGGGGYTSNPAYNQAAFFRTFANNQTFNFSAYMRFQQYSQYPTTLIDSGWFTDAQVFVAPAGIKVQEIEPPPSITATTSTTGGTLLAGNTPISIWVQSVNANGKTSQLSGQTYASPTPTGTTSSVAISWPAVSGATSYVVYVGCVVGTTGEYNPPVTVSTTSYSLTSCPGGGSAPGAAPNETGFGLLNTGAGQFAAGTTVQNGSGAPKAVCLADGTNCATNIPLGTAGQIPVMNAGATAYAPVTMSGDATISSSGVVTAQGNSALLNAANTFTAAQTVNSGSATAFTATTTGTANPTMSLSGSGGAASVGPAILQMTSTSAGGGGLNLWATSFFDTAMAANTYLDPFVVGFNTSTSNCAAPGFDYVGSGSTLNAFVVSFCGVGAQLSLTAGGVLTVPIYAAGGSGAGISVGAGAGTGATAACASGYTCLAARGRLTIVAGTSPAAGTIATVTFAAGTPYSAAPMCTATQNGGTTWLGVGGSGETAAAFNVTSAAAISGTLTVDYRCMQ